MKTDTKRGAWWFATFVGIVLTVAGLFGVWLQGLVYERGFPTPAKVDEIRAAFTLPAATTTTGSLIIAAVVLASPLTEAWTASRRLRVFVGFAILVLAACTVCGFLAGSRVVKILN